VRSMVGAVVTEERACSLNSVNEWDQRVHWFALWFGLWFGFRFGRGFESVDEEE
jgi:hypothetical protein